PAPRAKAVVGIAELPRRIAATVVIITFRNIKASTRTLCGLRSAFRPSTEVRYACHDSVFSLFACRSNIWSSIYGTASMLLLPFVQACCYPRPNQRPVAGHNKIASNRRISRYDGGVQPHNMPAYRIQSHTRTRGNGGVAP